MRPRTSTYAVRAGNPREFTASSASALYREPVGFPAEHATFEEGDRQALLGETLAELFGLVAAAAVKDGLARLACQHVQLGEAALDGLDRHVHRAGQVRSPECAFVAGVDRDHLPGREKLCELRRLESTRRPRKEGLDELEHLLLA